MTDTGIDARDKHGSDGPASDAPQESAEAGGENEGPPALDEILRRVRYLTDQVEEARRRERESPKDEPPRAGAAAEIARALSIQRADFGKWVEMQRRGKRRWLGLAIAAGFPAALVLGVLVQLQFEAIPSHDPTGGWRGHVWENYGQRIVDCAVDARSRDTEVDCPLVVRWP